MWHNGKQVSANYLQLYATNDNLVNVAQFQYSLYAVAQESGANPPYIMNTQLTNGNLTMTGDDYLSWEQNQYAWDWVAAQLNITYVEQTTTSTTSSTTTVK